MKILGKCSFQLLHKHCRDEHQLVTMQNGTWQWGWACIQALHSALRLPLRSLKKPQLLRRTFLLCHSNCNKSRTSSADPPKCSHRLGPNNKILLRRRVYRCQEAWGGFAKVSYQAHPHVPHYMILPHPPTHLSQELSCQEYYTVSIHSSSPFSTGDGLSGPQPWYRVAVRSCLVEHPSPPWRKIFFSYPGSREIVLKIRKRSRLCKQFCI